MQTPLVKPSVLYKAYDVCIITAANEYQAQGYREQIRWRINKGSLPKETEFLVFADPHGMRIGSGGSTIYVLYKLLEHFCCAAREYALPYEFFKNKRILILHSGGDSRRLPAYSAVGKIFTPLPTGFSPFSEQNERIDEVVTLFDLLINNFMQFPNLNDGQVIVTSGDVLLSFNSSEITFSDSGVTGLAYPGPVEVASSHGVYIVNQNLPGQNLRKVANFLQKPAYDELKACNGLDTANRAFIDTGVLNFTLDFIKALIEASGISIENGRVIVEKDSLCENLINAKVKLDIYKEFPFTMLGKIGDFSYSSFVDTLHQTPFYVYLLPYCEFLHIGTSRHLLQNFHTINYTASIYNFQNYDKSKTIDKSGLGKAFVYNSLIDTASIKTNGLCLIEGSYLKGCIQLDDENILTNIPDNAGDINLQKGICLGCVPVKKEENVWVPIIYGIEDDFKGLVEDSKTTFLNETFLSWMKDRGILPADLWKNDKPMDLWNAQLFPFGTFLQDSMAMALSLQNPEAFQLEKWKSWKRMSLQEILEFIDYERLMCSYSNLIQKINLENLVTILTPKSNLASEDIMSWCLDSHDYDTAARMALTLIGESEDILFQARVNKLLSNILRKANEHKIALNSEIINRIKDLLNIQKANFKEQDVLHHCQNDVLEYWALNFEDTAFELIREAIKKGSALASQLFHDDQTQKQKIQIRSDEVVWVCASSRLDFAGGWSDTPPYCMEHGGSVLNAAVKLNGQYPIQAIGKLHSEYSIKLNSIDLGQRVEISESSELLSYKDPTDWTSLPKAAFVVTGIIPEDTELGLQDTLKRLGTGIDLTIFSAVPAGSGLGTSSILGSAIIACLSRMLGYEFTHEDIFNRTLYMEQLMTTGGGWQDQIGGVVGGVKLIQTEPGLFQIPKISWTDLKSKSNIDMTERIMLYYTGYRRMAKGILRNIVGKYLDRDKVVLETIGRLREKSLEMKEKLDHRDIDAFGKTIAEVWELNKILDPGTSNENIEAILNKISHLILGGKLLGAGGGGFLFMVTKGIKQSQEVRKILNKTPPNKRSRFFNFDIDQEGLKVSVL
jgi:fucokinase